MNQNKDTTKDKLRTSFPVFIFLFLFYFVPSNLGAQTDFFCKGVEIKPYWGINAPLSTFGNFTNHGQTFGLSIDKTIDPNWSFGIDINHQKNDFDPSNFIRPTLQFLTEYRTNIESNWYTSTISLGPIYRIQKKGIATEFYAKVGLGLTQSAVARVSTIPSLTASRNFLLLEDHKKFGLAITSGLRVNFKIKNNISVFINPQYVFTSSNINYQDRNIFSARFEPFVQRTLQPSYASFNLGISYTLWNKVSISYFDGSLRNRQVVSRLNTERQATVGETIYDYQGRGAIQVLPTPAKDERIQYYELYNRPDSANNRSYSRVDFDVNLVGQDCDAGAAGMNPSLAPSGSTGSSNYYSDINSDQNGHQAYVPHDDNYPFTQIEYTPDNTGRIRRQSGVGPVHKLGTGHETKYFYGKPLQEHLDRLFGSEVGYFSHYKKNMVIDANGQISVSYLDQQGRVIATSLAGNRPPNLEALPSNKQGSPDSLHVNILDNQPLLPGENELHSTFTYLATTAGDHTFDYHLIAEQFEPNCLGNTCYDCVYDLIISVKDECKREMITNGPIRKTIGSLADLNTQCGTDILLDTSFMTYLEVGMRSWPSGNVG